MPTRGILAALRRRRESRGMPAVAQLADESGASEAAGRVCLFAQYDPRGRVQAHVLGYLANLRDCGFAVHVACSGMTALAAADRDALAAIGAVAYPRPNAGLDFGAWQFLMQAGCLRGAGTVLLANDSVFGPFADLAPIVAEMQARGLDAWGMVESREGVWHLQSWFLCMRAGVLARPAVRRVFAQDFASMSKREIILHGELALGVAFEVEELACGAVHRARTAHGLRRLVPVNPMHFHWTSLLAGRRVPFIKVELLRDNPAEVPFVEAWPDELARSYDYPAERITAQLVPRRAVRLRARRLLLWLLLAEHRPAAAGFIMRGLWRALPRRGCRGHARPARRRW